MADSASAAARGGMPARPVPPSSTTPWDPRLEPPLVRPLRPAVARRVVAASLGLGLLAQALFVGELLGVNVPLWIAGVLFVGAAAAPRPRRMRRSDVWLPISALVFALLVAIRETSAVVAFDLIAAITLTGASLAAMAGAAVTTRSLGGLTQLVGQGLALSGGGAIR